MSAQDCQARYRKVAAELREWIRLGILPPGTKLPSESELMHLYGVSRVTVRLAYGALRSENLVTVRQGRGAFVQEGGPTER